MQPQNSEQLKGILHGVITTPPCPALVAARKEMNELLAGNTSDGFFKAVAIRLPSNILGFEMLARATNIEECKADTLDDVTLRKLKEIRTNLKIRRHIVAA